MTQVNFKKMMGQEPEFDNYVRKVLIDVMLADPNMQNMLETINAFYQSGNTPEQTATILKNIIRSNNKH